MSFSHASPSKIGVDEMTGSGVLIAPELSRISVAQDVG